MYKKYFLSLDAEAATLKPAAASAPLHWKVSHGKNYKKYFFLPRRVTKFIKGIFRLWIQKLQH